MAERKMKTFIARFHNVYGPYGTWDGGREKTPAVLSRKVIEARDTGNAKIDIWGGGYLYVVTDEPVPGGFQVKVKLR